MEINEEQQKDINQRVEGFRGEYLALVEKYEVDFIAFPQYQQQQDGTFATVPSLVIADKKYRPAEPIKSPFVPQ